jgi:hypothetical protein
MRALVSTRIDSLRILNFWISFSCTEVYEADRGGIENHITGVLIVMITFT